MRISDSEHDMIVGRSPCGIDRPTNQFAGLVRRAKLVTNCGQSTKRAEVSGLIGENLPIGLLGCLQGVFAGNGDCRSKARPVGES